MTPAFVLQSQDYGGQADRGADGAVASKRLTPNLFAVATADSRNLSELRAVDDLVSEVFSR